MKVPKKVVVLGETYRVIRIKNLIEKDNVEGFVSSHEYIIGLDSSLKGKILERVYTHELAHALCFECGLHEFLTAQALEMYCQAFSSVVCNSL